MHPQHWPADLDYAGKRVVVIGSGATAVTLVPAMAETAAHVTMLQRSPSYICRVPARDPLARRGCGSRLPARLAYRARPLEERRCSSRLIYQLSRRCPRPRASRSCSTLAQAQLPAGYDVDTHFTPAYDPWDQRLCVVPDGDLFRACARGARRSSPTGSPRFTEHGIALAVRRASSTPTSSSPRRGCQLLTLGGMTLQRRRPSRSTSPETVAYKGMMLSGVPNFALTIGYTNASWTLQGGPGRDVRVPAAAPHGRHG